MVGTHLWGLGLWVSWDETAAEASFLPPVKWRFKQNLSALLIKFRNIGVYEIIDSQTHLSWGPLQGTQHLHRAFYSIKGANSHLAAGARGVAATSQLLCSEESRANVSIFQVTAWDFKAFSIFKYFKFL